MSKSFNLVSEDISGLINFALSLNIGSSLLTFRRCLASVVEERLALVFGHPPREVLEHQAFVLQLFGRTGTKVMERQHILQGLRLGDWRKTDVVEVYVTPGTQFSCEHILQTVVSGLCYALCNSQFSLYPRHRWLGADQAVDQVSMLQAIFGLATAVYQKFLVECGDRGSRDPTSHARSATVPETDPLCPPLQQGQPVSGDANPVLDTPAFPSTEHSFPRLDEAGPDQHGGEQNRQADPGAQALINARRRRVAWAWLETSPWWRLIIIRQLMQPASHLLHAYVARSGEKWQIQQHIAMVKQQPPEQPAMSRKAPLLEYVSLVAEKSCLAQLQEVMASTSWQWVPQVAWNLECQGLTFRLASRQGCLVHELLVLPTKRYPLKLFNLLVLDDFASTVLAEMPCMLDPFTAAFVKHFSDEGLASETSLTCLNFLAHLASTETIGIEHGHGSVHRLITAQQAHTHIPTMGFINAQWVCQKLCKGLGGRGLRSRGPSSSKAVQHRFCQKRKLHQAGGPPKRKRGGGGAWRAFVSLQRRGARGRADLGAVGVRYRAAKEAGSAEFAEAQRVGEAATHTAKTGAGGFGGPTRQVRRKLATKLRQQPQAAQSSSGTAEQPPQHPDHQQRLQGQIELSASLKQVRSMARQSSRAEAQAWRRELAILEKYQEDTPSKIKEAVFSALPQLDANKFAGDLHSA